VVLDLRAFLGAISREQPQYEQLLVFVSLSRIQSWQFCRTWQRGSKSRPLTPSVGPSWSWASVSGPICYPHSRYVGGTPWLGPTVEKVDFDHHNDDHFTILSGGSITLHGLLVQVKQQVLETTKRMNFGIIRPGLASFYEVGLDYEPDDNELLTNWYPMRLKWVPKTLIGVHTPNTSLPIQDLPDSEDMDDMYPLYESAGTFTSAKQCDKPVYCLLMGQRQDEGSRRKMFLLLECVDKTDQVYKRLGMGLCPPEDTLLLETDGKQSVTII
jgi:hypothetical protein